MNLLSAENLAKSYNEKWLFQDLSFGLSEGDKVAIVGKNGAGKSTLLKILAGKIPPDHGTVVLRKEIKAGLLEQDPSFDPEKSILETLFFSENMILTAIHHYEAALSHPKNKNLQEAIEKMEKYDAWDYEQKAKQIISSLGIPDYEQKVGSLSGGQTRRLALAKLLIEEPDLLMMDEPTNHLDLETVEWLEDYLSAQKITLLLVTHDRYFLDRITNKIAELDNGNLYTYKGNYSYLVEKKYERELQVQSELGKAKNLYNKELEWMRRQPRARGTKSKSRIDAFYDLREKVSDKKNNAKLELDVKSARQGNKILELDSVSKSYNGKKLIENFTYVFRKKDRIGIVGKNGVGKSTLLNILSGKINPDTGTVNKGQTTAIGYFSQKGLEIKEDKRVIDVVKEIADVITLSNGEQISIGKFLEHFLFPPPMQYTFVSKLSGGEKKRLQFLLVLVKNPNFLILDEPTNDLDIDTLNVLEDFLQQFEGSLLIVSHDRYFMDRLTDHLFVFEGDGRIKDYPGNYTDYRSWKEEEAKITMQAQSKIIETGNSERSIEKKKLSFSEKREFEILETEINNLENQKADLIEKLNSGGGRFEELAGWSREIEMLTGEIEKKTLRWLELSEKASA
jgi:ATP-binding cassette subfamily F protein uup